VSKTAQMKRAKPANRLTKQQHPGGWRAQMLITLGHMCTERRCRSLEPAMDQADGSVERVVGVKAKI